VLVLMEQLLELATALLPQAAATRITLFPYILHGGSSHAFVM
jgi:hypothetical protein